MNILQTINKALDDNTPALLEPVIKQRLYQLTKENVSLSITQLERNILNVVALYSEEITADYIADKSLANGNNKVYILIALHNTLEEYVTADYRAAFDDKDIEHVAVSAVSTNRLSTVINYTEVYYYDQLPKEHQNEETLKYFNLYRELIGAEEEGRLLNKLYERYVPRDEEITEILLENGFKLKMQEDGEMRFNDYVLPAVKKVVLLALKYQDDAMEMWNAK